MPVHTQIDLGYQKISHPGWFYLSHTTHVKQNIVFKGKHYIFSCLFFLCIMLALFALPILDFLLLTHFFLVIDFIECQVCQISPFSGVFLFLQDQVGFLPIHCTLYSEFITALY